MKMKKALALLLCAVLLVAGSVMGTLAYLTSQDEAVNNFTVGHVKISLDEADVNKAGEKLNVTGKVAQEGDQLADRVQTNDYHLLPGHYYAKDPQVHVTKGSEDCYVRMFVTITHDSQWKTICDSHKDENGVNKFGAEQMFIGLSDKWTLHEIHKNEAADNTRTYEFWYKIKVTEVPKNVDKDLEALFQGIQMPDELTNDDLALLADNPATTETDEGFKIYVVAQAIQVDGFADAAAAFGENGAPAITGNDLILGIVDTTP